MPPFMASVHGGVTVEMGRHDGHGDTVLFQDEGFGDERSPRQRLRHALHTISSRRAKGLFMTSAAKAQLRNWPRGPQVWDG